MCAAVNDSGDVIYSTNATSGAAAWSVKTITSAAHLTGISCASANRCVATDSNGNAWVAAGSPAPSSVWTEEALDPAGVALKSVSCTGSLCAITDAAGNLFSNTQNGTGVWKTAHLSNKDLQQVSCAQDDVCATSDGAGDTWVSANPNGGSSAWTSGTGQWLFHFACLSAPISGLGGETYCVGVEAGSNFSVGMVPVLGLSRVGTGSGTIGVSPTGTTCPSTCQKVYPLGTHLTLTATPTTGSAFSAWGGGCTASGLTCTLTTNRTYGIVAIFTGAPVGGGGLVTIGGAGGTTTFTCKLKTVCSGTVVVTTPVGTIAGAKNAAKPRIVGKASFRIKPHRSGAVRIHLTPAGTRLATHHTLHRVSLTITTNAPKHARLISLGTAKVRY
jgi:hypothetical protein